MKFGPEKNKIVADEKLKHARSAQSPRVDDNTTGLRKADVYPVLKLNSSSSPTSLRLIRQSFLKLKKHHSNSVARREEDTHTGTLDSGVTFLQLQRLSQKPRQWGSDFDTLSERDLIPDDDMTVDSDDLSLTSAGARPWPLATNEPTRAGRGELLQNTPGYFTKEIHRRKESSRQTELRQSRIAGRTSPPPGKLPRSHHQCSQGIGDVLIHHSGVLPSRSSTGRDASLTPGSTNSRVMLSSPHVVSPPPPPPPTFRVCKPAAGPVLSPPVLPGQELTGHDALTVSAFSDSMDTWHNSERIQNSSSFSDSNFFGGVDFKLLCDHYYLHHLAEAGLQRWHKRLLHGTHQRELQALQEYVMTCSRKALAAWYQQAQIWRLEWQAWEWAQRRRCSLVFMVLKERLHTDSAHHESLYIANCVYLKTWVDKLHIATKNSGHMTEIIKAATARGDQQYKHNLKRKYFSRISTLVTSRSLIRNPHDPVTVSSFSREDDRQIYFVRMYYFRWHRQHEKNVISGEKYHEAVSFCVQRACARSLRQIALLTRTYWSQQCNIHSAHDHWTMACLRSAFQFLRIARHVKPQRRRVTTSQPYPLTARRLEGSINRVNEIRYGRKRPERAQLQRVQDGTILNGQGTWFPSERGAVLYYLRRALHRMGTRGRWIYMQESLASCGREHWRLRLCRRAWWTLRKFCHRKKECRPSRKVAAPTSGSGKRDQLEYHGILKERHDFVRSVANIHLLHRFLVLWFRTFQACFHHRHMLLQNGMTALLMATTRNTVASRLDALGANYYTLNSLRGAFVVLKKILLKQPVERKRNLLYHA